MFTPPIPPSIDPAGGAPPINRSSTIKLNYATFMSTQALHWCRGEGRGARAPGPPSLPPSRASCLQTAEVATAMSQTLH